MRSQSRPRVSLVLGQQFDVHKPLSAVAVYSDVRQRQVRPVHSQPIPRAHPFALMRAFTLLLSLYIRDERPNGIQKYDLRCARAAIADSAVLLAGSGGLLCSQDIP